MSTIFQRVAGVLLVFSTCAAAQTARDIAALKAKAESDDAESQFSLGSIYENGQGVPQDYAQAAEWYRKAAESGNVRAQDQLAYLYDQGSGVPQDDAQAAFWMRKAAEQGDSWAQWSLGTLYSEGLGVSRDDKLAALWWRKAAAQGVKEAQKKLADSGDTEAQRQVGSDFESECKYSQAAFWLRKAAGRGDPEAQYKLGHLYSAGHGVPQDKNLAAVWWRKAADQGNANAQSSLGLAYINGDGVPSDFGAAAFWLRRSAEQGNVHGQTLLSIAYEVGWGVPKDYAQAAAWTQKAAEQGDASAQGHLGDMYRDGQGVPQSLILAEFWYGKAASQGNADAQNALEQVKSKLAAIEAERQRRQNQILIAAVCLVFLGAVTFTAIRLRKKLIGYGRRLYPQTSRSRQLAVLLLVGCWCSACCLLQVLSRRAMLHPVNAAVTALLWAFPGLILGAVCMWWLSHPLPGNDPVPAQDKSEGSAALGARTQEDTQPVTAKPIAQFRWGMFQGWVILVIGVLDLLDGHPILLGNMYGRWGGILLVITGIGLINRAKEGLVLFFICNGALLAGFLWTFRFSMLSFDFESMSGVPLALLGLLLAWWLTPAIFYYPKRWKEFSRSPSETAPRDAP
ncbi:MAG: tetratricopeptide repeat protein [Terracidiphilus sp.]